MLLREESEGFRKKPRGILIIICLVVLILSILTYLIGGSIVYSIQSSLYIIFIVVGLIHLSLSILVLFTPQIEKKSQFSKEQIYLILTGTLLYYTNLVVVAVIIIVIITGSVNFLMLFLPPLIFMLLSNWILMASLIKLFEKTFNIVKN